MMEREELAKTIKILKSDNNQTKGFSLRRTIKKLHQFDENKETYQFKEELLNNILNRQEEC